MPSNEEMIRLRQERRAASTATSPGKGWWRCNCVACKCGDDLPKKIQPPTATACAHCGAKKP